MTTITTRKERQDALEFAYDLLPEQHRTGNQLKNLAEYVLAGAKEAPATTRIHIPNARLATAPVGTRSFEMTFTAEPGSFSPSVLGALYGTPIAPEPAEVEPEPAHDFAVGDRVHHKVYDELGTVRTTEEDSVGQIRIAIDGNRYSQDRGIGRYVSNLERPEPKVGDRIRKITEEHTNLTHAGGVRGDYLAFRVKKGSTGRIEGLGDQGDLKVRWDHDPQATTSGEYIIQDQVAVIDDTAKVLA